MNTTYDYIILGTGLTECILGCLLSLDHKTVLQIDKNDYYGGACASLNLEQAYQQFGEKTKPDPAIFGNSREWNLDLVTKFLMTRGKIVQVLICSDVKRYLEFRCVDGTYVHSKKRLHKVPASESEALTSKLMGPLEKYRFNKLLHYCTNYDMKGPVDNAIASKNAEQLLRHYRLESSTIDFVGHSIAMYRDDSYLTTPALELVQRIKLYIESLAQATNFYEGKSPFLYPTYGLGDIPQAFSRLSAVYGGTFMLSTPFDGVLRDESGKLIGIQSGQEKAFTNTVIGDPSYFLDKVKKVGKIIRAICILDHTLQQASPNAHSALIIIPQKQVDRHFDIYINFLSYTHQVAPNGKYLAIVSTHAETDDPGREIEPALNILRPLIKCWISVLDCYEPIDMSPTDGVLISKSYDATPHFETIMDDVSRLYKLATGEELDLEKRVSPSE